MLWAPWALFPIIRRWLSDSDMVVLGLTLEREATASSPDHMKVMLSWSRPPLKHAGPAYALTCLAWPGECTHSQVTSPRAGAALRPAEEETTARWGGRVTCLGAQSQGRTRSQAPVETGSLGGVCLTLPITWLGSGPQAQPRDQLSELTLRPKPCT